MLEAPSPAANSAAGATALLPIVRPSSPPVQARDSFFECVEAAGVTFTVDTAVPAKCKEARAAYVAACKASWVKHFDLLQVCRCGRAAPHPSGRRVSQGCRRSMSDAPWCVQDKRLRYLQTLRTNIAQQTQTGTGSQQGKPVA